jgi:murein DD-endopeptidase MepM/ murein hydrolase activator NlpD
LSYLSTRINIYFINSNGISGGLDMFWDKRGKKSQPLHEYYQNKKYAEDYDWIDYYRPRRKKATYGWGEAPGANDSERRGFYRIVAVLVVLALLFTVKQLNHPVGEDIRLGLRYILTTDWDIRPAMEKAVSFGLQMAGVENHLESGAAQEGMLKETVSNPGIAENMLIPVSGKVVREYGWNKDPLDDMDRFHHGIDIAVNPGTPVKAALRGKVIKSGSSAQYGKYVLIDHGDGVFTLYAGIANIKVSEGQEVEAGQTLGEVAQTGDIKGGGLHFELRENGSLVDPMNKLEIPPGR